MTDQTTDEALGYDFDVAVSFAGEDREYVEDLVRRLQSLGAKVFYDEDELAAIWGENLVDFLEAVYTRRARYAILFVSRHYVRKKWTGHERQSMQDRALRQSAPYILPVRLDDTSLSGLHSTVGYLDARQLDIDSIVNVVIQKLGNVRASRKLLFDGKVPRTSEDIARLLEERPRAWEYLLYGAVIRQGIEGLKDKYRDHVIGYARRNGVNLYDAKDAMGILNAQFATAIGIVESLNRVLDPSVQEAAFGRRGEAGDPDRIMHIARRFVDVYEEFLDWAANLRATGYPNDHLRRIAAIQARLADKPIEALRSFVESYVAHVDTVTSRLEAGERVEITLTVTLDTSDEIMAEHTAAWRAYHASIK